MLQDFKNIFQDDYIKFRYYKVRPFSIIWWIIKTLQIIGAVIAMWSFYIILWCIFS